MTRKMQAAQVQQFGQPLALKELDIPTPGVNIQADLTARDAVPFASFTATPN